MESPCSAEALSYQHATSGEWAHNLLVSPSVDAWRTYLEPVWRQLVQRKQTRLRVVEVGFGRGFNLGVLCQRWVQEKNPAVLELHGFEPHPKLLQPWPEIPPALLPWMPWWGADYAQQSKRLWQGRQAAWTLQIHPVEAQATNAWKEIGKADFILVDLFSPGRHPEDWRAPLFELLSLHAQPGAILSTYTCARWVREGLEAQGWTPQVQRRETWRDTLVAHFGALSDQRIG